MLDALYNGVGLYWSWQFAGRQNGISPIEYLLATLAYFHKD